MGPGKIHPEQVLSICEHDEAASYWTPIMTFAASLGFPQRACWEITTAGCGAEALEAWPADGRPYDAVVMDLNMPGLNGYETYCRLRRLHPETRCLFITGHANADLRAAIHREGLVCLDKPVPMEDLIAHVRELLK